MVCIANTLTTHATHTSTHTAEGGVWFFSSVCACVCCMCRESVPPPPPPTSFLVGACVAVCGRWVGVVLELLAMQATTSSRPHTPPPPTHPHTRHTPPVTPHAPTPRSLHTPHSRLTHTVPPNPPTPPRLNSSHSLPLTHIHILLLVDSVAQGQGVANLGHPRRLGGGAGSSRRGARRRVEGLRGGW
jgi:hypothetical protein